MLDTIIGGLLLPFELYFQPQAFRRRVNQSAPGLLPDYTLLEAIRGFKDPVVRRGVTKLLIQFFIALLWLPALSYAAYLLNPNGSWSFIRSGLLTLPALALALGFGAAVEQSLSLGIAFGVAIGVVFGVSSSFNSAVLSSISNITGMEVALVVDRGLARDANALIFGISIGLITSIFGSIFSVRWTLIVGLIGGIAAAISFQNGINPATRNANVLMAIIATVTLTHVIFWPIHLAFGIAIWLLLILPPSKLLYAAWHLSPLYWDEFLALPLPGSIALLARLYKFDPVYGQLAIDHVTRHPFQSWAAHRATKRIETDEGWH